MVAAMIWKPNVTVAAITEQDNRFLMVEEIINGKAVYNQPAGHLDEGESLVQAVIRETLEETAWHFQPTAICGIYRWMTPEGITFLRIGFAGICNGHESDRPLDTGILQALWLSRAELLERGEQLRSPMVLCCIDDYLAGKRYPLSLLQDLKTA